VTAFLAQRPRRAIDRLYRRHVGGVYRCALALLGDPVDAAAATRATFARAYLALARGEAPRAPRAWLTDVAFELCRERACGAAPRPREPVHGEEVRGLLRDAVPTGRGLLWTGRRVPLDPRARLGPLELAPGALETLTLRARRTRPDEPKAPLSCAAAERALSRRLDGALTAAEAPALHAHVLHCARCAAFDRRQRAQRDALRALASLPVPPALDSIHG
jgi:hypothetical protein